MIPPLRRILFVEDDPDIALLGQIALEDIGGYQILTCNSAEEALAQFADFAPDIAVLDYRLPGKNGGELMVDLHAHPSGADLPVVFLTASVTRDMIASLRELGAADVIAKPFDPLTLAAQVEAVWQQLH